MKRIGLIVLFVLVCSVGFATNVPTVEAVDVTFTWNESPEPDIAGYRIFVRTETGEYDYGSPIWEGATVECTVTVDAVDVKYYFVGRAFDKTGNESADSNEVGYMDDLPPAPMSGFSCQPQ